MNEEDTNIGQKEDKWNIYFRIARFWLVMLIVIALGIYIVNSIMDYRYKVAFIKSPCGLCAELNKNQSSCVQNCFIERKTLFMSGIGELRDDKNNCYDTFGKIVNCKENNVNEEINYSLINLEP